MILHSNATSFLWAFFGRPISAAQNALLTGAAFIGLPAPQPPLSLPKLEKAEAGINDIPSSVLWPFRLLAVDNIAIISKVSSCTADEDRGIPAHK